MVSIVRSRASKRTYYVGRDGPDREGDFKKNVIIDTEARTIYAPHHHILIKLLNNTCLLSIISTGYPYWYQYGFSYRYNEEIEPYVGALLVGAKISDVLRSLSVLELELKSRGEKDEDS